jgi:hypothetical protein
MTSKTRYGYEDTTPTILKRSENFKPPTSFEIVNLKFYNDFMHRLIMADFKSFNLDLDLDIGASITIPRKIKKGYVDIVYDGNKGPISHIRFDICNGETREKKILGYLEVPNGMIIFTDAKNIFKVRSDLPTELEKAEIKNYGDLLDEFEKTKDKQFINISDEADQEGFFVCIDKLNTGKLPIIAHYNEIGQITKVIIRIRDTVGSIYKECGMVRIDSGNLIITSPKHILGD